MKVSLQEMRRMGMFEEIEQPEYVYHMTSKENANKIIEDGKVKVFDDYICFFFDDIKWIPLYIWLYGYDQGRSYTGIDGLPKVDPPLDHADTVVLKLKPRRKEPMVWYREIANSMFTKDTEEKQNMTLEQYEALVFFAYRCRLCHYDDFAFRSDDVEVLELTDIDATYPHDHNIDAIVKFIQENGLEDAQVQYVEQVHERMKRLGIWGKY